jgi:Family of unknown function (DUF6467)
VELYCNLILGFGTLCTGYVGGLDSVSPGTLEPLVGYHAKCTGILTVWNHHSGQSQAGSLTGAVASQRVTEAHKGHLRLVRNQPSSAMA